MVNIVAEPWVQEAAKFLTLQGSVSWIIIFKLNLVKLAVQKSTFLL